MRGWSATYAKICLRLRKGRWRGDILTGTPWRPRVCPLACRGPDLAGRRGDYFRVSRPAGSQSSTGLPSGSYTRAKRPFG
jgi:hypothetical protein